MSLQKGIGHYYQNIVKEGNTDTGTKHNVVKEAMNPSIAKIKSSQLTKQINHKYPIKKEIHPALINLTKVNHWINQVLLQELTQNKQLTKKINQGLFQQLVYPKSTKIENPSETNIRNDGLSISVLSGHTENLSSVTPYQQRIP